MKYNGINVSEQEIVAKVLEDQNAWRDFSINCTFSIEEIEKYKDNIIWDFYYRKINSTYYSQEEIEKILSIILDNDYLKDSKYILKAIFSEVPVSIEFIKKYATKIPLDALVYGNVNYKIKKSELLKFGLVKQPKIGDRVSVLCGSDCYPYEIIDVSKSMLQITLRRLKHTPTKNFDYYSYQEYEYTSDENGSQVVAKLTKYGNYKTDFGSVNRNGARYYVDPSF